MPAIIPRFKAEADILTSDPSFCKTGKGRSDDAAMNSATSLEKSFYFGNRNSDTVLTDYEQDDDDDMSEFPHFTGFEQMQTRARVIAAHLSGSTYGYKNEVYLAAAAIFERLAVRKEVGESLVQYPSLQQSPNQPTFTSQQMKRQSFELAYETLKYQELLEEILMDSSYFVSHPAGEDTTALVMVMLFDLQNRKWGPRCIIIGDEDDVYVKEIESNLMEHRVHLSAALARNRVKHQSLNIDYVLPDDVRNQEKCATGLPQYAWINTMKCGIEELITELQAENFKEYIGRDFLIPHRGKFFRRDTHCDDVLIFPADQKENLKSLKIVEEGKLVLQDKTSSLAVASIAALLTTDDDCDLIHTDVASGLTTAHLAIILYNKTKKRREKKDLMYSNSIGSVDESTTTSKVIAFGAGSDDHRLELIALFERLGIVNIQLLAENFSKCDPKRDTLERVKAILIAPRCTRTAVSNPIEFMLNEGDADSFTMLKEFSHGDQHKRAIQAGIYHTEILKSAMQFRSVQAIVYITRSIHAQENEQAVNNAVKWHKESNEGSRAFRISPPTLPLLSSDINDDLKNGEKESYSVGGSLKHNFLRMRQTSQMNGCFIAVLSREVDLNDAARKGALQGLISLGKEKKELRPVHEDRNVPVTEKKSRKAFLKSHTSHKAKTSTHHIQKKILPSKTSQKSIEPADVDKLLNSYKRSQQLKETEESPSSPPPATIKLTANTELETSKTHSVRAKEMQFQFNKPSASNKHINKAR